MPFWRCRMALTLRLFIDGRLIPGSSEDTVDPTTGMYASESLSITWGRDDSTAQPEPSSCSFDLYRPKPLPWLRAGKVVVVTALLDGAEYPIFVGSVTSMTLGWDEDHGPLVSVIADDVLADLGNRAVGMLPWPQETAQFRIGHIMRDARQDVPVVVPASVGNVGVGQQRQTGGDLPMATPLLQQLAAQVDAVLWPTAVQGTPWRPQLTYEDTSTRPALRKLALKSSVIVIILDTDAIAAVAITLDSCLFTRDAAQFTQAVDDYVTGVSVNYVVPSGSPDVDDAAAVLNVVDPGAESPGGVWGVRRIKLDTILTSAVTARASGEKLLGRLRPNGAWRAPQLLYDSSLQPQLADGTLVLLLDVRSRQGKAIQVPMPDWAPNGPEPLVGFLEGGTIGYRAGSWVVDLTISSASSYGAADARWDDIPDDPAWKWDAWQASISWDDLMGVGGP